MTSQLAARGRRAATLLGALSVLLTVLSGCSTSSPVPQEPELSTAAERAVDAAWVQTGPQSGGYGRGPVSSAPASLYATAWTLRLALDNGELPRGLDRKRCVGWLKQIATSPGTGDPALTQLDNLALAVQGLRDLRATVPTSRVAANTEKLRSGSLYRGSPTTTPNWSDTYTAVHILSQISARIPDDVRDGISNRYARSTDNGWNEDINSSIPVWQSATLILPRADRQKHAKALHDLVDAVWKHGTSGPADGFKIGTLADVRSLALQNGTTVPNIPASWFSSLQDSTGMLALSARYGPDPHTTAKAMELGYRAASSLQRFITAYVLPTGWPSVPRPVPDPQDSYYGLALTRSWGDSAREAALAALTQQWVTHLKGTASATLVKNSSNAFYVAALARLLGVPFPKSLAYRIHTALEEQALKATPKNPLPIYWAARFALLNQHPLKRALRSRIAQLAPRAPVDVASVMAFSEVAKADSDPAMGHTAETLAGQLKLGPAYRSQKSVNQTDLLSTAIGLAAAHATSAERLKSIQSFVSGDRACLLPLTTPRNSCDLNTRYLSLAAERDIDYPINPHD
ncbi:hypothetical protein [Streptomyces sp. NBC_00183]|uniref:hypothetical protein n=1 Tax=Streptomyces sp. NBC_00183 TaxID=2903633 RepID=UPI002251DD62|nr:hypothetical protein [Streptomyces sp. NBC_00183]MCX5287080.1 hypothetical protein [Streptomyces sp. NBC_00183]